MSRWYIDHHNVVHFDPSPDGRAARAAAMPKAMLLVITQARKSCTNPKHLAELARIEGEIMLAGRTR